MAIVNSSLSNTPAAIYTSSGQSVVTTMYFCNTDNSSSHTVSVYVVPNGGTADDSTVIYKNVNLVANDTMIVNQEKLILSNGDAVYANANASSVITSTVGYIGL